MGGSDEAEPQRSGETAATATETSESADFGPVALARRPRDEPDCACQPSRARIVVMDPKLGCVLSDANNQIVYGFETDRKNRSNCTSPECVKAWPPVLTRDRPSA